MSDPHAGSPGMNVLMSPVMKGVQVLGMKGFSYERGLKDIDYPLSYRASAETKFIPSPDCCYKQTGLAQIGQIGPNLSSPFLLTSSGHNNNNQNWV